MSEGCFLESLCWEFRVMTADGVVCNEPGFLGSIVLTPSSSGAATALLYNGFSTSDELLMPLSTITSYSKDISLITPIPFTKGLYVDIGSNVTGLFLQFVRKDSLCYDLRK